MHIYVLSASAWTFDANEIQTKREREKDVESEMVLHFIWLNVVKLAISDVPIEIILVKTVLYVSLRKF